MEVGELDEGSAGGERSLLIVHGRDFKPGHEALMDMTGAALRAGVERDYPNCLETFDAIPRRLAYYGDLSNALLESRGKHYDATLDLGDRNNALKSLRSISVRKRFGIRQYDCLPGKSALPEFLADVGAPLLGALGLTMPVISRVSRDFHEYLSARTTYAEQVRERIRSALCELLDNGDRVLLMSHGTGCVIVYDVLWQLCHDPRYRDRYGDFKIDTWITLGAPLGDNRIRKRLLGARSASDARFPTNVITWYNVSAEDDYTCHDNTLADDFKAMMHQRMVSAVHDFRIYNLAVRYGRSNPHSSVGYYIHPRITKIVVDWIQATQLGTSPKYIL